MTNHLQEAHEELESASEHASRVVRKQLRSIEEGVAEEVGGDKTQTDPGPKADRVEALEDTLNGLVDEASEPALIHIERARRHLRAFREDRDGS